MHRSALLVLSLLTPLAGCAHQRLQKPAAEYQPGTIPTTSPARFDGIYVLIRPEAPGERLQTVCLGHGEEIGFRQDPGGLVAVAGGKTVPVPDSSLVWVRLPADPNERPVARAAKNTLIVAGGGVLIAGAVVVSLLCLTGGHN